MVYVLAKDGSPLMPTKRCGKVRHMLKDGRARVVSREPFTIQLMYETPHYTQDISLGVDCGSRHVGLSATTKGEELFSAELELRADVSKNITARREFRRARRNRKTRYRKPRFNNRRRPKGWLAPSIQNKVDTHASAIDWVMTFLPVREVILEVGEFDTQRLKEPDICGKEYRHGEQYGFYNVKRYVLWRDGYICQRCRGKSKDKKLNVHHIVHRAMGGSDRPGNLVTLCETCHKAYHAGSLTLPKFSRSKSLQGAAHMNTMRYAVLSEVRNRHPDLTIRHTYGYITKAIREEYGIAKTHAVDARIISGNPEAVPLTVVYKMRRVRRHNRQIHKAKILKGGIRKRNQAAFKVNGFQLFDKVSYHGLTCFITGRRTSGYFALRDISGSLVHASARSKDIKLVSHSNGCLIQAASAV